VESSKGEIGISYSLCSSSPFRVIDREPADTGYFFQPNNLASSGIELVLAHTMYAIIGAIALEKGGHVANKVARERVLAPLGLKTTA
jgi:hypothetical protein